MSIPASHQSARCGDGAGPTAYLELDRMIDWLWLLFSGLVGFVIILVAWLVGRRPPADDDRIAHLPNVDGSFDDAGFGDDH